jgi:hypothetical protein
MMFIPPRRFLVFVPPTMAMRGGLRQRFFRPRRRPGSGVLPCVIKLAQALESG